MPPRDAIDLHSSSPRASLRQVKNPPSTSLTPGACYGRGDRKCGQRPLDQCSRIRSFRLECPLTHSCPAGASTSRRRENPARGCAGARHRTGGTGLPGQALDRTGRMALALAKLTGPEARA
jgi:hypothetical protein